MEDNAATEDHAVVAGVASVPKKLGYVLGGGAWVYAPGSPVGLPPAGSLPLVFFDALRSRGWKWTSALTGKNLNVFVRKGMSPAALGTAAQALEVTDGVDVIVLPVTRAIPPAIANTNAKPLVVVKTYDEVLQAEIVRKGGATNTRVVGLTINTKDYALEVLNLLQQVVPKVASLAMLYHTTTGQGGAVHNEIYNRFQATGVFLGINVQPYPVTSPAVGVPPPPKPLADQIDDQLAAIAAAGTDALLVLGDGPITSEYKRITDWAIDPLNQVPTIGTNRQFTSEGGLMAFGPDEGACFRRAAAYVDMLLQNVNPMNLGREYVGWWDLTINNDTAKAIGVTFPKEVSYAASAKFPGGSIYQYILPALEAFADLIRESAAPVPAPVPPPAPPGPPAG